MANNDMLEYALDQAKTDEALEDIDIGYIRECIDGQLDNLLETDTKKNYLKILKENFKNVEPEYADQVSGEIYPHVISSISEKFKFEIDTTEPEYTVETIAKKLYKFFVVNYTKNITMFFEMLIIEKRNEILEELRSRDGLNDTHIPGISADIGIILNNLHSVMDIISGMEIDFDEFLYHINLHEDAGSEVERLIDFNNSIMNDTDEIVPTIFDHLKGEGFSTIFIGLQEFMYQRFIKE